ncbi:MAG: phage tail tube protein [Bacteroidia bacterium]
MATTGIVNGTLIGIYVAGTKVANAMSNDLDISMAVRDTTNKDTAGWKTGLGGMMNWSCSGEGLFAEDAAYGFDDLFAVLTARVSVTVMISSAITGDKKYSGSALLTNLKRTAGLEDNATFTVSFEGTGPLTEATI